MNKYKIKLHTCNQDLQLTVSADTEENYRAAAKQANNIYELYKNKYNTVSERQLLSFLLLIMTMRAMKADTELQEARNKNIPFWKRLKMLFAQFKEV